MKFKTISRSETAHTRDRRDDVVKVARNADPLLHPLERAREYTRALNAAKLDKMFAKPLVAQLEGHSDGIWCMAPSPRSLSAFVSGATDGQISVWDLAHKRSLWSTPAHTGFVRGVSVAFDGQTFYTCGDDKAIKHWRLSPDALAGRRRQRRPASKARVAGGGEDEDEESGEDEDGEEEDEAEAEEERLAQAAFKDGLVTPLSTYSCAFPVQDIDCHWADYKFATCGDKVDVWDQSRMEPITSFEWGVDSVTAVRFNPAEQNLLATTGSDRSVCLYDIRQSAPLRKVVLRMRSNMVAWNPMEPLNFTLANEDHNLYSFDMRSLNKATMVHKDHVGAVMDVSYSPTGKEFVTASYDRTIRLFKSASGRSHQVYHSKRMQRCFCSIFSRDATFVLSGSDDSNIRIWKAEASKPLGRMLPRERVKLNYNQSVLHRYKHVKEINRIARHQLTPKQIKKEQDKKRVMSDAQRRKTSRQLAHNPKAARPKPERERSIVKELE